MRSWTTWRRATTREPISLEVDLRRYLTDADRLQAIMISMREGVERRLAEPVTRLEAG